MHVLNAFISCLVAVLFYPCEKRGAASPEMSHAQSLATLVRRAAKQVWAIIRFLLDEFEPWLKWLVFDAVLRLVVAWLISKSERLRSFFGMLGFSDL